ncbi:PadR family transcriptional regulator [Desmospora activa]|uniref:PadR family transcriptional regulator n=1 Tax=Desmospora activa DSM 45169 TaxID=1121389 RepID=A0A2T4Z9A4_9BACL|nr:PadR family transcriptional regulator [Desmospora activa]PTM58447.1 PadR family transcriptional regulator [Desmospora activa DSM 45169]
MTMTRTFQRSPLSLAVLALLYEEPMHPYRIQQLIKERGKDQVVNVQRRGSLYQTIKQLQRAELIEVQETLREENRPERTIYRLTHNGLQTALNWLREMLSTPAQEYPLFPAAISFLPLLTPADAQRQLELRVSALIAKKEQIESELQQYGDLLPRLFLLESEYLVITIEAELKWVRALIEDLRSGRITWSEEWLRNFDPSDLEHDSRR